MVAGTKRVELIDPSRNEQLYEGHMREAVFSFDEPPPIWQLDLSNHRAIHVSRSAPHRLRDEDRQVSARALQDPEFGRRVALHRLSSVDGGLGHEFGKMGRVRQRTP